MRFFLASLVLAVTLSLAWLGIVVILDESKLGSFIASDFTGVLVGGIIIVVALSFGIPLIIRLFKAKREDP